MRRLVLVAVLAVVVAVFGSVPVVAGPDNAVPYIGHVDPVGEGGSYVPKADGPSDYPNYEKQYVYDVEGPGEGGSYVPKVAMAETDDSSSDSSDSSGGGGIVGSITG